MRLAGVEHYEIAGDGGHLLRAQVQRLNPRCEQCREAIGLDHLDPAHGPSDDVLIAAASVVSFAAVAAYQQLGGAGLQACKLSYSSHQAGRQNRTAAQPRAFGDPALHRDLDPVPTFANHCSRLRSAARVDSAREPQAGLQQNQRVAWCDVSMKSSYCAMIAGRSKASATSSMCRGSIRSSVILPGIAPTLIAQLLDHSALLFDDVKRCPSPGAETRAVHGSARPRAFLSSVGHAATPACGDNASATRYQPRTCSHAAHSHSQVRYIPAPDTVVSQEGLRRGNEVRYLLCF